MITLYNNKKHFIDLLLLVSENSNYEFYITEDNNRLTVKDRLSVTKLFKNVTIAYISEQDTILDGIMLVWQSIGGNVKRNYVKFNVLNKKVAENLLNTLVQDYKGKLYIKIKKDSSYLELFKDKDFRFCHDRGRELLLMKEKQ